MPGAASSIREALRGGNHFLARDRRDRRARGLLFRCDTGIISVANVHAAKSLHFGTFGESWPGGSLLLGAISGAALAGWVADALSLK